MTDEKTESTFFVPLPDRSMDELAALLAPFLDDGCVAVGPGWALFSDARRADAFADTLSTATATHIPARQPEAV